METKEFGDITILEKEDKRLYIFETEGYCTGDFEDFREFLEERDYEYMSKKLSDILGTEMITEVDSEESSNRIKSYIGDGDCVKLTSDKGMISIPYKMDTFKVKEYTFFHLNGLVYDGPNNLEYTYEKFITRLVKDNRFNIKIETL